MYNNGLTIVANDIISEETNARQKLKITIKGFQIVNGGQTVRTIHKFNKDDKDHITKYLSTCEVLLRIFKTQSSTNSRNKIAEYTNSQNAISSMDLKSLSGEQIQIEQFLDENNIIYARKTGDTGLTDTRIYSHKISMEKFGQILFSIKGFPEKASNQKKQIFEKYYNDIFGEGNLDISKSAEYVRRYYEIKNVYDSNDKGFHPTDQKIFFIMYIDGKLELSTKKKITFFEKVVSSYEPNTGKPVPEARKLIQKKFKEALDNDIQNYIYL